MVADSAYDREQVAVRERRAVRCLDRCRVIPRGGRRLEQREDVADRQACVWCCRFVLAESDHRSGCLGDLRHFGPVFRQMLMEPLEVGPGGPLASAEPCQQLHVVVAEGVAEHIHLVQQVGRAGW